MTHRLIFFLMCQCLWAVHGFAKEVVIADNGRSPYKIVIPANGSGSCKKAADVLHDYILRISGADLPVATEGKRLPEHFIAVGGISAASGKISLEGLLADAFQILAADGNVYINSVAPDGLQHAVYYFLEKYAGCTNLAGVVTLPKTKSISITDGTNDKQVPAFQYREVYYPAAKDPEYCAMHGLQKFEDLWGLWGHSYDKLVPAKTYFRTHPEYYAQVAGKRQATQLCLSNENVFNIVVATLRKKMEDNPDAVYWSVSPNDDIGYCECEKCKAVDDREGGPAGSLITFVNRVAKLFPEKKITTLAYGFTHRAPKSLVPGANVYVFLSDIDAYRDKPLAEEGSAAGFRNDLRAWRALTPNIYVWDYITEFTNYLAPFPNWNTLQANMKFFRDNGVKGVFEQGSGDTYSEFAELRSYLTAKLLWNPDCDIEALRAQFLKEYYGIGAAPFIKKYIDLIAEKMTASKRKLDIYGNPVNEFDSYLTPDLIETYGGLFDKAEAEAEADPERLERVVRCRLPIEYTVYQQARFYGIEKHGIFVKSDEGAWAVRPRMREKLAAFVASCKKWGVTELSEGGLSPDDYQADWEKIFDGGVTPNKALGANVTLAHPFAPDYPAKGNRTLTDGNPGYADFSYNWLCFYGVPMQATVDLGKATACSTISVHFLDDPRHWIFLPSKIAVEVSQDGKKYKPVATLHPQEQEEHYNMTVTPFQAAVPAGNVRYIRVTADNLEALPEWRVRPNKKPMIACDEIFVQ